MNRLEEILENARDEEMYCIECFSADEANECLEILDAHGWRVRGIEPNAIFNGVDEFGESPVTCVALWLYGDDQDVAYTTLGYDDYQKWYKNEFGEEDKEPDAVMRYDELFDEDKPDDIDSDDFGTFLDTMG